MVYASIATSATAAIGSDAILASAYTLALVYRTVGFRVKLHVELQQDPLHLYLQLIAPHLDMDMIEAPDL